MLGFRLGLACLAKASDASRYDTSHDLDLTPSPSRMFRPEARGKKLFGAHCTCRLCVVPALCSSAQARALKCLRPAA